MDYPKRCSALLLVCLISDGAYAQSIDEIIVTARKTEESLQQVPVAVTAFTAETIGNFGLTNLDELARFTPGFSFASSAGRQPSSYRPTVRGITTIRNGIANVSAATTFIDGIYLGGSAQSTELSNLERVEILRGPQSAQFGRGTYVGAINYVTRKPADEFEAELTVRSAEYETSDITGWISGPVVDGLVSYYLAAGRREYGGEYTNIRDGSTVGGEQSDDLTAKLRFTPTDDLDITLKLGLQETDDDHAAIYLQPATLNNCCFRTAEAPRAREYFQGVAQAEQQVELLTDLLNQAGGAGTRLSRRLAALSVSLDFGNGYSLSSLTGWVDDALDRGFDSSYAGYDPLFFLPGFFTQTDRLEQSDLSQELRISSSANQAVRWSAGLYYYDGELDTVWDNRVLTDGAGGVIVLPNFTDLTRDRINNRALFGSINWDINTQWSTSLEMRWAEDDISVTTLANDGTGAELEHFEETFSSFTPRFTLSYAFSDDLNSYLNIAKGTKSGDFNTNVPALPDGSPDESFRKVDEEVAWSYELGIKAMLAEQRVLVNLAAYYLDVTDQQLTEIIQLSSGGTASIIDNVGKTEVLGFEAEVITALTDYFTATVTYAYTDSEIKSHISSDEADLNGSDGSFAQNQLLGSVAGNTTPRVPEHMASLVFRYERPLFDQSSWYFSGDYSFESSRYAQVHNLIETGDRSLVGLRAGIILARWELSVWAKNLLDNDTPVDIIRYFDRRSGSLPSFPQQGSRPSSSPRGFALTLPRGRQWGATIRIRF